jgi:formate C-acetyltransferase
MSTLWEQVGALRDPVVAAWPAGPACRREAEAFRAALLGIPIGIRAGDVLAGDFGPEWGEVAPPAGKAAGVPSPTVPAAPSPRDLLRDRFHIFGGYTAAHTTLDYGRLVSEGLDAAIARAREHLSRVPADRRPMLESMAIALEAVCVWAGRYAVLGEGLAAASTDGAERQRLTRIAWACRRVPRLPARDLHEALQAVWLLHAAVGLSELCQSSLSLGSLDQYLLPFYQSCPDPALTRASLRDLFGKLNRYGDAACALNLGGADGDGQDRFNPLSALIVETVSELRQPAPLLAARIHVRTPQAVLDRLCTPELAALGQPTFYGEESCLETLRRRGVAEPSLRRWCANSCMGLYLPGEEISDMWGGVVNLLLALELALNGGRPLCAELPVDLEARPADPESLGELKGALLSYVRELVDLVIGYNREATAWVARERPNPFLSAVTADCLERGLDRAGGGARYHTVVIEAFGLVNAADALTALDQVVFRAGRYGLSRVTAALAADFAGAEDLRRELLAAPKFGRADEAADAMVRWLADAFAEAVTAHNRDGVSYLPSFHTLNAHIAAGAKTVASADGRHAGQPLAKNLGPTLGQDPFGHTAVLLSCVAVDQARFSGGQAVDLSLDGALLGTASGRAAFQALLRTYFGRGGTQVQINGVTPALLRAAMAEPERHGDLTVRIAGYSARFVTLPRPVQEEMVQRFERGL